MDPLPNPPIKEALVDIRIAPLPPTSLALIEALHDKIRERYPTKKARHRWVGSIEVQQDRLVSAAQRHLGPEGFLFSSTDEQQIVQYRLDGFTFNRLAPYPPEGWPAVRAQATPLWELYAEAVQPTQVVRIGLRYINEIRIPFPQIDLEEYFSILPHIPSGLPQQLDEFLTRLVIPLPDVEGKAIVTLSSAAAGDPQTSSLILDIDVLTSVAMRPDTAQVWSILDRFREIKNNIFKTSLTAKTMELFQ